MPASLPYGPLVPGAEGAGCVSMAWLCVREDSQGRFPGRPGFLLEVGVRTIFLCVFGLGIGVVTMAT